VRNNVEINIFTKPLCARRPANRDITATRIFCASANAQSRTRAYGPSLHYADLDLNSEDGQATLQGRLKDAGFSQRFCEAMTRKNLVDVQDHVRLHGSGEMPRPSVPV